MKLKPQGANQTELTLPDGTLILYSYQTPVACHIEGEGYFRTLEYFSRTTSKHIAQWLARNGAHGVTLKEQEFFDNLAGGKQ
jgi:hypothetical protein